MTHKRFIVEERAEEQRYVLLDNGEAGEADGGPGISADYVVAGEESYVDVKPAAGNVTQRVLFHTGADEAYAGQGLASVLVQAVVDDVIAAGLVIVPVCPYVAAWLKKHPEYAAHVIDPATEHLQAVRAQ